MSVELAGSPGLREQLVELERTVDQLTAALASRVKIEQAKGILAERFELELDEAFVLLRSSSRASHTNIHALSAAVVAGRSSGTPAPIVDWLSRARLRCGREESNLQGPKPTGT